MSFDIIFRPCRYKGIVVEKTNPFTEEVQTVLANEPLNAAELRAVKKVLKQAKAPCPAEHGCYFVELDDGGGAEVFGSDLETGCMVALRGMTPDLCRFLYALLKAGNWVLIPAMEDAVAITASLRSIRGVPDDFPRIVVCNSVEELAALLADGVRVWAQYRDQFVGDDE